MSLYIISLIILESIVHRLIIFWLIVKDTII